MISNNPHSNILFTDNVSDFHHDTTTFFNVASFLFVFMHIAGFTGWWAQMYFRKGRGVGCWRRNGLFGFLFRGI
jgi:hypothetical protein